MRNLLRTFISASVLMGLMSLSYADNDEFCAGFEEGYKSVKGEMVMVPMCPMAPMTPIGSTDFREGLKAGMKKANGG